MRLAFTFSASLKSSACTSLSARFPARRVHFTAQVTTPAAFRMLPSHQNGKKSKVLVLGAGNFGSCLADHLGDSSHTVYMWSRSEKVVSHFNQYHRNPEALQDHIFSESITAVGPELPSSEFIQDMDVLLFAIPTEAIR